MTRHLNGVIIKNLAKALEQHLDRLSLHGFKRLCINALALGKRYMTSYFM